MTEPSETILFVTGKLAEPALQQVLEQMQRTGDFQAKVQVLGINVAALMHVPWVARKLILPEGITRVVLPGWCQGDLAVLTEKFGVPFERGPKDLRELPRYFRQAALGPPDLSAYDVEILAEINHAPRLTAREILSLAEGYRADGADRIDYGCLPGGSESSAAEDLAIIREHIRLLVAEGFRVSIDSFDRREVETAVEVGADLVLSCNSTNIDWACELDVEYVVVPDDFNNLQTMQPIMDRLTAAGRRFRLDPILEPIGFGFFRSVQRYSEARKLWPDAEMMMGVGNVSELSEVDSAGVNFLLMAICQELGVRSVLTTQVINWARGSVRELDLSRRLLKYALDQGQIPKHIDSRLVQLRDPYIYPQGEAELAKLAAQLKDPNFRIFAEPSGLHLMNRDGHWQGEDPFALMQQAMAATPVDAAHAFYLGYELAQAETARLLGKQYRQDEPLRWGEANVGKRARIDGHTLRNSTAQNSPSKTTQQEGRADE